MMRVFVLEDNPVRIARLKQWLPEWADLTVISSCTEADTFDPVYDLILLDHDLGGRQMEEHEDCGLTFVQQMKDRLRTGYRYTIVYHSFNPDGAKRMEEHMRCGMIAPFGSVVFKRILTEVMERCS